MTREYDGLHAPEAHADSGWRKGCSCGTPSEANFYTRIIYTDSNGETVDVDRYTCTDHTDAWMGGHVIGETVQREAYQIDESWRDGLAQWFGVFADSIIEVTQTELR